MRQQRATFQYSTADRSDRASQAARSELVDTEDLHLRNYDRQWGYDLSLEVLDEHGDDAFEQWYYLQPGQVVSELDVIPAGEYEVRVTMDNLQEEILQCRIDVEHTVVIEVGNGALSLTQGVID